jgi:hypothetical protein
LLVFRACGVRATARTNGLLLINLPYEKSAQIEHRAS